MLNYFTNQLISSGEFGKSVVDGLLRRSVTNGGEAANRANAGDGLVVMPCCQRVEHTKIDPCLLIGTFKAGRISHLASRISHVISLLVPVFSIRDYVIGD